MATEAVNTTGTTSTTAAPGEAPEMMDMQALLDSEAGQQTHLRRGQILEGVVLGASADGVIVDVGIKSEAIIPPNEMRSLGIAGAAKLRAGDTVRVMVLQPMTAEGHAVVSLDRARGEEGWATLSHLFESGEIFEAEVIEANRGGLVVNVDGVNGFVPLSQIESVRRDDPNVHEALASLVGRSLKLKVMELNRRRNRVILSEKLALAEWRQEQKERVIEALQEGEIRTGRVTSVTDFGVFVDIGGADGLAHATELTWERGKKPSELFSVGDEVKAYVLKVDRENKKISLSLKRAQPEQWEHIVNRYVVGQILIGRVSKLMPFGAFVRIEGPVEGLVHISELTNRRIQHPREVVKEGDVVPVKLIRIERDRHRLGLSLRQARHDAEAMGFVFDASGAVVDYPDDVRQEFGLPPRQAEAGRSKRGRTPQEIVERAVSQEPEAMSAIAHAFAQALEAAEGALKLADAPETAAVGEQEELPSGTPAEHLDGENRNISSGPIDGSPEEATAGGAGDEDGGTLEDT